MTDGAEPSMLELRLATGVTGIDTITRGGLFKGGIYIVVGRPGSGKTTVAHQVAFHHVKRDRGRGRVAYVTLLSESHARMVTQMRSMSFYDEACIGSSLVYINGFSALESEGLDGLLKLLRGTVRDQRADLLVLDGLLSASAFSATPVQYKKFINELQSWVGVVGCTVLFLTTGGPGSSAEPEYTMVDGIVELRARRLGLQRLRHLAIRKFRGTSVLEGSHCYEITGDGLVVYPRIESQFDSYPPKETSGAFVASGVAGLDAVLGGGFRAGSATVVLGPSGAGKTTLGLQFLAEGARHGERGLYFGFYEPPAQLVAQSETFGLSMARWVREGAVQLRWRPPAENIPDALAYELVIAVRSARVSRLVVDGLFGFTTGGWAQRLPGFCAVLNQELRALGVTTLMTEEGRRLHLPGTRSSVASALFDNVVELEHQSRDGKVPRQIVVRKARQAAHLLDPRAFAITDRGIVVAAEGPRKD
jgi:circadian clock protein KaiC